MATVYRLEVVDARSGNVLISQDFSSNKRGEYALNYIMSEALPGEYVDLNVPREGGESALETMTTGTLVHLWTITQPDTEPLLQEA